MSTSENSLGYTTHDASTGGKSSRTPAVEFQNVTKSYGGGGFAVRELSFAVEPGKLVTLIGPSGCGKTTTLKMINRLIEPTAGRILVEGDDIARINPVQLRRKIGYVIQQIGLFPHMTIEDNISLVPRLQGGTTKAQMREKVEQLLDLIGLDAALYRKRYPRELSGGQQQRIGVARALASDPSIILMDEPFSALDPISREQLQDELVKLQESVHKTIVFVTHDMDEALKISDLIVLMQDGHIVQADTADQLLRHPKNDFVRDFIGAKRFQQAAVLDTAADVMSKGVTVRPNVGLASAVETMRRRRVNGLIVVNGEGKYLGLVGMPEIYQNYGNEQASVGDIMHRTAQVATDETPIEQVFNLLEQDGRGYVPVISTEEKLLGVVTRASVINIIKANYQEGGEQDERIDSGAVAAVE